MEERRIQVLMTLGNDPKISALELAGLFGVSKRTIERDIMALRNHGEIYWMGDAKKGHWKVKK